MQFTFIESGDNAINKATASESFVERTTENKEAVRLRPGDISNHKNHIISLRFIFNQKTSIYLTLIQCIPVFSP